jgi:hypothetical protein
LLAFGVQAWRDDLQKSQEADRLLSSALAEYEHNVREVIGDKPYRVAVREGIFAPDEWKSHRTETDDALATVFGRAWSAAARQDYIPDDPEFVADIDEFLAEHQTEDWSEFFPAVRAGLVQ